MNNHPIMSDVLVFSSICGQKKFFFQNKIDQVIVNNRLISTRYFHMYTYSSNQFILNIILMLSRRPLKKITLPVIVCFEFQRFSF